MVTPEEAIKSSLDPDGATFGRDETIYLAFKQFCLDVYLKYFNFWMDNL